MSVVFRGHSAKMSPSQFTSVTWVFASKNQFPRAFPVMIRGEDICRQSVIEVIITLCSISCFVDFPVAITDDS